MISVCPHCGAANDAGEGALELTCQKCGQTFAPISLDEVSAQRRAMWKVLAAIVLLFTGLALLLVAPGASRAARAARETVFGAPISGRTSAWRNGDGLPDSQTVDNEAVTNSSIGRLPERLGPRRPGDEVRPGAAGTDEPMDRVGNSRTGPRSDDNSGGGDPGNANRNSVETPGGSDMRTGRSNGENPSALTNTSPSANSPSTNRSGALLLDDFSERLRQAGARSGDVQVSLEWKNLNDLDLHVFDPSGEEIFYGHRHSVSGGLLDVDMNASSPTWRPVENVYWPDRGAPKGRYRVDVVHYANHGSPDPTHFTVRVVNKGQMSYFRGFVTYLPNTLRARVTVCQFDVQ